MSTGDIVEGRGRRRITLVRSLIRLLGQSASALPQDPLIDESAFPTSETRSQRISVTGHVIPQVGPAWSGVAAQHEHLGRTPMPDVVAAVGQRPVGAQSHGS